MKRCKYLAIGVICMLNCLHAGETASTVSKSKKDPPPPKTQAFKQQTTLYTNQEVNGAWDASVFAAFTYWYANTGTGVLSAVAVCDNDTALPKWNVKTRPGFIVGFSFLYPETLVDIDCQYTWFYNKQGKNKYPTHTLTLDTDSYLEDFRSVGGSVANTFNRIDLLFNKRLYIGKRFDFTPGVGLVGNWAEFWFDRTYSNGHTNTGNVIDANTEKVWGVGPYAQAKSRFSFLSSVMPDWNQLLLLGNGGVGLSWQQNKPKYVRTRTHDGFDPWQVNGKTNWITSFFDVVFGLRWEMVGDDYKYARFALEVDWATQAWYNYTAVLTQDSGTLYYMQGLSATFGVYF